MAETINKGWLKDTSDIKFAPKTLVEQVQDSDGKLLSVYLDELNTVEVSSVQPTNETTQLWINPNVNETASLPEIKDNVINNDDTWSSAKINDEINKAHKVGSISSDYTTLLDWCLDNPHASAIYGGLGFEDSPIGTNWGNIVTFSPRWDAGITVLVTRNWNNTMYFRKITYDGKWAGDDWIDLDQLYVDVNSLKDNSIKTIDVSATLKNLSWTKSNDGMCYAPLTSSTYGSKVVSATICGWGSLTPTYTVLPYITVPNKVSLMCPVNSFSQYASVTVRIVYVD